MLLKARETCGLAPTHPPLEAIRILQLLRALVSLFIGHPFCISSLLAMELMEVQVHGVDSRDCVKGEDTVHDLKAQVPPPHPCPASR